MYREGDGANQAVRCVWQRSTLHRPSHGAASAIARRCVFGDRLMPAGALFLSIPALQRSKGVAGRANGHVPLSPKRKLEPCTRTFLTSYLPEALHLPTFPTLCKQQRKGNGQEAGALPCLQNAAHRIRRCCILCNAQKYGTAANAVRSKGARGLILL